jgi:hypothetical protein
MEGPPLSRGEFFISKSEPISRKQSSLIPLSRDSGVTAPRWFLKYLEEQPGCVFLGIKILLLFTFSLKLMIFVPVKFIFNGVLQTGWTFLIPEEKIICMIPQHRYCCDSQFFSNIFNSFLSGDIGG